MQVEHHVGGLHASGVGGVWQHQQVVGKLRVVRNARTKSVQLTHTLLVLGEDLYRPFLVANFQLRAEHGLESCFFSRLKKRHMPPSAHVTDRGFCKTELAGSCYDPVDRSKTIAKGKLGSSEHW